ncbi:MAG: CoB--CoM heterodisulfide reductase iron-sulfur subunit B family protein [Clostridia bacterium]|nr:CoB--CoM heterodisulfide reductase iron-sulfur subunit B family protein [Clostridia bacterium]
MTFSYYPGCTLSTKAKELDQCGRAAAKALGIELQEIEAWQCCGAVYPQAEDEIATKLSAVRALNAGKEKGQDVLTLCSACHHVLKRVNDDMKNNEYIRTRANNYLKLDEPYAGEANVVHYLEMLRDTVGFDNLKKAVKNPLKGVKIAAYYGCLLLRPSNVMAFDDPENPKIIEDFIKAIGATPVVYSQKNECCGGYMAMEDKTFAQKRVEVILSSAKEAGADMMITACPLCLYNLAHNATDTKLPIKYFTELLAEALGLKEEA